MSDKEDGGRCKIKRLEQYLDTSDDSFSYTVIGDDEPLYHVDSSGYLTEKGAQIGKFHLGANSQWHLRIGNEPFMSGPEGGLFYLPEFELKALTALLNLERAK